MLIGDLREIGNRILSFRKSLGRTQAEIAEKADLSDRSYADIERGNTNMRIDTLIKICRTLGVTPNDLLVREEITDLSEKETIAALAELPRRDKRIALRILSAFLDSVK